MKNKTTPWRHDYDDNGFYYATDGITTVYSHGESSGDQEAIQKFTVAVNSHDELVEALEEALEAVEELNGEFQSGWDETIEKIEAALKKAKT
jgi:hypothetical protein